MLSLGLLVFQYFLSHVVPREREGKMSSSVLKLDPSLNQPSIEKASQTANTCNVSMTASVHFDKTLSCNETSEDSIASV